MDQRYEGEAISILAVEDQAATRMILDPMPQTAGYAVDVAACGAEAIKAMRLRSYDLVLLDLGLPDMDGYTFGAALRGGANRARRFSFVALTARNAEAERGRAADLNGYITKPFQPLRLLDEIRRLTSGWPSHPRAAGDVLIWDRPRKREIADRLVVSHVEAELTMFENHLVTGFAAIQAEPVDVEWLARQALAFGSRARMLGSSELAREPTHCSTRSRLLACRQCEGVRNGW